MIGGSFCRSLAQDRYFNCSVNLPGVHESLPPKHPATSLGLVFLLPALLLGLVGTTIVETQARRPPFQSSHSTIESAQLTQSALAFQREQQDLKQQLSEVRSQLDAIQEQAARVNGDARELQQRIDALKAEAGMTPVSGAGVIVTLDDARLPPSRDTQAIALAIVHSQDITDVINAAWKGGAVAIAVNGERITGASACVGATIQINGTLMSPPFAVSIVGPGEQLSRELRDAGQLADLRARQRAFGLGFDIATATDLRLPAYTGSLNVRNARIP